MRSNPRYFVLLVPLLLVFFLCFTYAVHADELEGEIESALSTETPDLPLDFLPPESSDLDSSPAPVESPLPDSEVLSSPAPDLEAEPPLEPMVEPTPSPTPEPTIWKKPFNEYTTSEGLLFCLLILGFLALVARLFLY